MLDTRAAERGLSLLADNHPREALALLQQAVREGEHSAPVLLGVAKATEQSEGLAQALTLYQALPRLLPDSDDASLRYAEALQRAGLMDHAEAAFRNALDLNPNRSETLLGLGNLLILRGNPAEAQMLLLRAGGLDPKRADVWHALGMAFAGTRNFALACTCFLLAQKNDPRNYQYAMHRAEAAWRAEKFLAELALIEKECSDAPLDPVLLTARGMLLALAGQMEDAADTFEAACLLDPEASKPALQRAVALMRLDRNQEAIPLLRGLYARYPDNSQIANDLAAALMRSQWHAEAARILSGSLENHGWSTATACNLVITLLWQGRQAEAVALAKRAIAAEPHATQPWRVLCNALPYASGHGAAEALETAQRCAATLPRGRAKFPPRDPGKRLRIGLLSNLMRTHPAGWLTVAGFEALDRSQFEIFVFGRRTHDSIARRIATISTEWVDIDTLNDHQAADAIRARQIDILIDLGGMGDHGRLPVCALRPAPVQIKWVGMQNASTGLPEIDYMISDRWETPPELAHFYSEKLLILPDGYVCYSPPAYAPHVAPLPALTKGAITFSCFNNLAKITDEAIAAWSRILAAIPNARLICKTHQFSEEDSRTLIHGKFAAHGIDAARILLEGRSPHREFLETYNRVDIALDPFPYSGGLGTCEALWMGVPTVTLPGETFASRHSHSHLNNVGLTDWSAHDVDHYVALAIEKASDIEGLATLRAGLRERMKVSPLCDAPKFGKGLEKALKESLLF